MFESPESANLWFDIFNGVLLTGAFLVAVGTWGTIKTAAVKERFSDERVSANELETKRAVADSDAAKEGTAKANEAIAKANAQIAEANEGAAKANERAAALEKEAAQARAEQERLKLLVAWRQLPDGNKNALIEALRRGSGNVLINHALNDPEAQYFALQLENCFAGTPWKVGFGSMSFNDAMPFGIFIWGAPDNGPSQAIKDAFTRAKILFSTQSVSSTAMGMGAVDPTVKWDVTIFIGSKPR